MFRKRFEKKLIRFVREFFANHPDVTLIAVTGSAGKMSAKVAIATVLAQQYNVAMHEPEPTSQVQTLLQIMGVRYPDAKPESKWSWWQRRKMLRAVKRRARAEHPEAQVIIQEFSPRDVGFHAWFEQVIVPTITVVTSVTTGRMHVEHSVEEVAQEMLTLANHSHFAFINRDDIEGRFAAFLTNPHMSTYGSSELAEYYFRQDDFSLEAGHIGKIIAPEHMEGVPAELHLFGEHNVRPAIVAAAVAIKLGLSPEVISRGLASLRPLPGRMQVLRGADQTIVIDDSYSSSPLTARAALQSLYSLHVPQRIAVLGNMNGLRQLASEGHAELGAECSADMLDWVVTVGEMANQWLAPAARQKGCQVKECRDALEAGAFVRERLHAGGVALFKGSSGGVWLEEAVKLNLRAISDADKLVRQSPAWLARKDAFFSRFRD